MDLVQSTWWWIATGALVALELLVGTFYPLMLALGAAVVMGWTLPWKKASKMSV